MTAREWLQKNAGKYSDKAEIVDACVKETKLSRSRVLKVLRKQVVAPKATLPTRSARTLADFRHQYDKETIVPSKIKAQLKKMNGGWLYEVEFAKDAGISLSDLGLFRESFAGYVVSVKERRIWAGSEKLANEMRQMI